MSFPVVRKGYEAMFRTHSLRIATACLLSAGVVALFSPMALAHGGGGGGGHGGGFGGGGFGGGGHFGGGSFGGGGFGGHFGGSYAGGYGGGYGGEHLGGYGVGGRIGGYGALNASRPYDRGFWNNEFGRGGEFPEHGFGFGGPFYGYNWWPWYGFGGYYGGYYPYGAGYYGDYGYDNGLYAPDYTVADASGGMPDMTTVPQPAASREPSEYFTEAVAAFQSGDYANAVRLAGHAAIDQPRDANVHLLLSMGLFALGNYRGAAMEAHAVAALGPIPDWNTVYGFYGDVETYTKQLRALETFVHNNPKAPEGQFLLGFVYLIDGYQSAARDEFLPALMAAPQDRIAAELLTKAGGTVPAAIVKQLAKQPAAPGRTTIGPETNTARKLPVPPMPRQ